MFFYVTIIIGKKEDDKMVCPQCGNNVEENANVCGQCGTPLNSTVPEVIVPQDFKFQDDSVEQTYAEPIPEGLNLETKEEVNKPKKEKTKKPIKAYQIVILVVLVIVLIITVIINLKQKGII